MVVYFRDGAFANVYACLFKGNLDELDFDSNELNKNVLEVIKNESGSNTSEKCFKKGDTLFIENTTISFDDFLVNKGENAYIKYGKVLELVISELEQY